MTDSERASYITALENKISGFESDIDQMIQRGETPSEYIISRLEDYKIKLESLKNKPQN